MHAVRPGVSVPCRRLAVTALTPELLSLIAAAREDADARAVVRDVEEETGTRLLRRHLPRSGSR